MTNSIGEIGDAACILSIGSNTTSAHPVIGVEVKRALRQGGKLIVANPREIDLCKEADIWIRHRPGSDVALLMGMMWVIVDEGLLDLSFVQERCENFEAFLDGLKDYHPGYVEGITGVKRDQIVAAARMYATHKPASILYTMGITQHTHGTDNVMALADLAMLTGNIGKPSSGVNPLRGQNNVQGACDMGSLPTVYPGYQSVADEGIQKKFEEAWGVSLSNKPGRVLGEIIEGAGKGEVKAVYLIGENPVLSDPDAKHVEKALEKLEFLVVQDIFLTETAKLADVVLPAASFAEKEGTFTNTERRVQRVRKVVEAVGEAKADWWIVSQVAQKMGGKGFEWGSAEEVMEEAARLTPSYGGITYPRLEGGGIQWPCPTLEHPGTKYLHRETFTRGKGKFAALKYRPSAEEADDEYPLILTTERSLYHFHTSTMTRKVEGLRQLREGEWLEINPEDAVRFGVKDGEKVKVISRRGEVEAKAKVTEVSPVGVVCMTFHFAESPTNVITNPAVDPVAKIPELKVAAVKVVPLNGEVEPT
jgi:formate dehydrogenase alpha subunit